PPDAARADFTLVAVSRRVRESEGDRTLHAHGAGRHSLQVHGGGPSDVHGAVQRRAAVPSPQRADSRVRVPRGELRVAGNARGGARGGAEGGGEEAVAVGRQVLSSG